MKHLQNWKQIKEGWVANLPKTLEMEIWPTIKKYSKMMDKEAFVHRDGTLEFGGRKLFKISPDANADEVINKFMSKIRKKSKSEIEELNLNLTSENADYNPLTDDIRIERVSGGELEKMGWDIGDDSKDDMYDIIVKGNNTIEVEIYAGSTPNETVDSGWSFDDFDETVKELIEHDYLTKTKDGELKAV